MNVRRTSLALLAAMLAANAIVARAQPPTPSPAATASQSAMPSALELFERTFERLQSYPQAPYAVWSDQFKTRVTETGPSGRTTRFTGLVRYAVRLSDGAENYTGMPVLGTTLPPAEIGTQFLGPFGFALRPNRPPAQTMAALQPDVPQPQAEEPSPLKTIARVTAYGKPNYTIELAADKGMPSIETVAGHRVYHLRLRPIGDGHRHNLRDLWVDVSTFDLWAAHFDSTYSPDAMSPTSDSDVTVWFAPVATHWVVAHAVWTWEDYSDATSSVFDSTSIQITFPQTLPDWLFDRRAYAQHQRAKEPDYLGPVMNGEAPPTS